MSTVLLAPLPGRAHEVTPAIADITAADGRMTMELRFNAEAWLAGIDLDGVSDTNETDQADDYDALRALSAPQMEARIRDRFPDFARDVKLLADGVQVAPGLDGIAFDDSGDVELPRFTQLSLSADIPLETTGVQVIWPAAFGALVLRQQGVEDPFTGYLSGGEPSPVIAVAGGGAPGGWQSFLTYISVGFDHILPKGLDHILFVLGLFFLAPRLRPLLWQVSAFTLAHTVTLALGAMGWVRVPGNIVEPLIAASIVYVAVENVFMGQLSRFRPVLVFGFGLLHGLGFASVLEEFGLPDGAFIPALIGFNVGVELGQLTVIALAFLALGLWFRNKPWYRARISVPASLVIAAIGAWWVIERVFL